MDADLSHEIQRFEEKFAENPDSLVFARLADLYRKAGEPGRALEVLDEGLDRHPDYLSAHIVRARALRDLDRDDEAERVFERVLRMDAQNLVALRSLGELALERGDEEEARRRFESLLELDPRNAEIRERLEQLGAAGPEPRPEELPPESGGGAEAAGEEVGDDGAGESAPAADRHGGGGSWWRRAAGEEPGEGGGAPTPGEPADAPGPDGEGGSPEGAGAAPPEPAAGAPAGPGGGDAETGGGTESGPVFDLGTRTTGEAEEEQEEDGPATAREEAEFLGLDGPASGEPAGDEERLPAEEGLRARIEELAVGEGGLPEVEEGDEEDLLTETLASLYETQGFYEEAVEMYEELLRQRPGDEGLRKRLEDARSALETTEPPAGAGEGEPEVPEDAGDDVEKPSPPAEPPPAGEGEAAGSVRDHLRALLRGEAEPDPDRGSRGSGA